MPTMRPYANPAVAAQSTQPRLSLPMNAEMRPLQFHNYTWVRADQNITSQSVEEVAEFTYLGSVQSTTGRCQTDWHCLHCHAVSEQSLATVSASVHRRHSARAGHGCRPIGGWLFFVNTIS